MSEIQSGPRRALITGGGSGFGLAIAEAMLADGAQVAIGDIDRDRLQNAERDLGSGGLLAVELDVTSPKSAAAAVAACEERFGGLDTLVNSAGVIAFHPLEKISEAEWDRVLDVDLKGTFLCCQAAAPLLCANGRGRIDRDFALWRDHFLQPLLESWLKGAKSGAELYGVVELGPQGSGYALECFPDVWKDACVARGEIEKVWRAALRTWKG